MQRALGASSRTSQAPDSTASNKQLPHVMHATSRGCEGRIREGSAGA